MVAWTERWLKLSLIGISENNMPLKVEVLIQEINQWVQEFAPAKNEPELHHELLVKLREEKNLCCLDRKAIDNPVGGVSEPDIQVIADDFILVIEVKLTGDWRHVAEAAWQLFQAKTLLDQRPQTITALGVFGQSCQDPILMEMLRRLSIESVWAPWP
ncbi:hypothetical protein [Kozakia baliensis]|uniref:hypothetical protein n=1 Tax=Kozakia baliensis TaxID=153496 RepID=UPI00087AB467|nr:hypothetical protein [Kozakia baliensis]AOX21509.1 hypothetical protein A0U90_13470 [Kozakia baliensis]